MKNNNLLPHKNAFLFWFFILFIGFKPLFATAQIPQFELLQSSYTSIRSTVKCIETDQNGNIFYAGDFAGWVDFFPGNSNAVVSPPVGNIGSIFIIKLDANNNFVWVKTIMNNNYASLKEMKLDSQGNILLCGQSGPDTDIDPGQDTLVSNAPFILLKLDNDGELLWSKDFYNDNPFNASFSSMLDFKLDGQGNIYVAGLFKDTIDFDFGNNIYNLGANNNQNYLLKLDHNGNFIWVKSMGDALLFNSNVVLTIDSNNHIIYCAQHSITFDIDPDSSVFLLNGSGSYIAKFDSAANFIWAKQFSNMVPTEIISNSINDILLCGSFTGVSDFNPDSAIVNKTSVGGQDLFILKLNSSGVFEWVKTSGSTTNDFCTSLVLDANDHLYVTGNYHQAINFTNNNNNVMILQSNGSREMFLLKLDMSGNVYWVKSLGGPEQDWIGEIHINQNNLYLGGAFNSIVDFDIGPGVQNIQTLNSSPGGALFLLKMNFAINLHNDTVTICHGDSIILNSGYSIGNLWNTGDTSQYIYISTSGQYYASINNGAVNTDTTTVIVIQDNASSSSISISTNDTLICPGTLIELSASSSGNYNPINYFWSINGVINSTIDSTFTITVDSTSQIFGIGNYSAICIGQQIMSSNTINVNTYPPTEVIFDSGLSNTVLCTSDPAFNITGGTPTGGIYSGIAVNNGVFTPNASQSFINIINYTYQDSNQCSYVSLDTIFVDVCTSTLMNSPNNLLRVFPTSASDKITIEANFLNRMYTIDIIDVTGKIIASTQFTSVFNELPIFNLVRGVYIIAAHNDEWYSTARFIKE